MAPRPAHNDSIVERNRGIYDASTCHLERQPKVEGALFLPSVTVYGTWKIKYQGSLSCYFVGRKDDSNRLQPQPGAYCYAHAGTGFYQGHLWIRGRATPELFANWFQENVTYSSYGYPRRYSLAWRRDVASSLPG